MKNILGIMLILFFGLFSLSTLYATAWPGDLGTQIDSNLPALYEPSGIIYQPDINKLLTVSDGGTLTILDMNGTAFQNWTISGDLEGVTIDNNNVDYVYIAVENP